MEVLELFPAKTYLKVSSSGPQGLPSWGFSLEINVPCLGKHVRASLQCSPHTQGHHNELVTVTPKYQTALDSTRPERIFSPSWKPASMESARLKCDGPLSVSKRSRPWV